ncbi:MAG: Lrp/AsnC family transcriptional regulator [Thermodesulfobacteriota bacterium]
MRIDETSLEIIKRLKDGRKSFREIAQELSISENTVRSRVNRLQEEGILEIAGLVDPSAMPGHALILVGVKLLTMELVKKGEELSRLRGVVSVSVVTGRFDIILLVLLNQEFGLLQFYTEEMSRVKDVGSVETFVVYKSFNLKVSYIL